MPASPERRSLHVQLEKFPLKQPFKISGYTMEYSDCVTVTLTEGTHVGRGEAAGVYYFDHDQPANVLANVEALRDRIEGGLSRQELQTLLPPGGTRNAIDCALWDLEASITGTPVWKLAGLPPPRALLTTFTVGANDPEKMAQDAIAYDQARAIKIKLTGDPQDSERVRAIRAARPEVWLGVDGNQGFTRKSLDAVMPALLGADVQLIEQPFRIGEDALLDDLDSPIPLAVDESLQGPEDLARLAGRYDVANIKLDKCGGLTAGLAMAHQARDLGLDVMVGNMVGTSLAMAPAFIVGQLCDVVDLDGPVFLSRDRDVTVVYSDGLISLPDALWGAGRHGASRK